MWHGQKRITHNRRELKKEKKEVIGSGLCVPAWNCLNNSRVMCFQTAPMFMLCGWDKECSCFVKAKNESSWNTVVCCVRETSGIIHDWRETLKDRHWQMFLGSILIISRSSLPCRVGHMDTRNGKKRGSLSPLTTGGGEHHVTRRDTTEIHMQEDHKLLLRPCLTATKTHPTGQQSIRTLSCLLLCLSLKAIT